MHTHVEPSQATPQATSRQTGEAAAQFDDLRSEALLQRKAQALGDASPGAARFQALQHMADASPMVQKIVQLAVSIQRQAGPEEEEPIQGCFEPVQRREDQTAPNNTGLPDQLKTGVESLSGTSMVNVRVHYNSSQPAQLNALAFTQGTDIHVAPGQERHLPHEAWHVVQQAQGRVQPTMQMKDGIQINDDRGLEHEADVMGERAVQFMAEVKPASVPVVPGNESALDRLSPYNFSSIQPVQKVTSRVADFDVSYNGTVDAIKDAAGNCQELYDLFSEQFPEKFLEDLFSLFGLNGLKAEEQLSGAEVDDSAGMRLQKSGNQLNIFINHSVMSPMDSNLHFINGPANMDIHRWSKGSCAQKGMGARVFDSIRRAGMTLGLSHFEADAIGDGEEKSENVGYYVWTRYGFDQDLSLLRDFSERIGLYRDLLAGQLAEFQSEVAAQEGEISTTAAVGLTDLSALSQRETEIKNGAVLDNNRDLTTGEQAEIKYINQKCLIIQWEVVCKKHADAIRWYGDKAEGISTLNKMMISAEKDGVLEKVAAMWFDLGQHVPHAQFDLGEGSTSQKVFKTYTALR